MRRDPNVSIHHHTFCQLFRKGTCATLDGVFFFLLLFGSIFSVLCSTPTQQCQSKLLKTDDVAIINAKCLTVFGIAISLGCCSFEFSVAPPSVEELVGLCGSDFVRFLNLFPMNPAA